MNSTHPFDVALSVPLEDLQIELSSVGHLPWSDFLLNPRRLRGSDFLMRWSQGVWSEERIVQAVAETGRYLALPYGPSSVAPDHDVRATELYFERLDHAGLGRLKRPDLLLFKRAEEPDVTRLVKELGGVQELPFTPEQDARMAQLLARALLAIECENSLWRARRMPAYNAPLRPQKRLGGKPGLPKSAVLPTVILKDEDRKPLRDWQSQRGVKIHIWHVFYDMAFGLALDEAERLIQRGAIQPTKQVYQAPGGPTTAKVIYKIYHHYAYPLGEAQDDATLAPDQITDKNGHILPYVRFKGGTLKLAPEAVAVLDRLAGAA